LASEDINKEGIVLKQKKKYKVAEQKPKVINLIKDNKKYKLILKSLKTKIEDLGFNHVLFSPQIVSMMLSIHHQIQQISHIPIFQFANEVCVLERFVADNLLTVGYFTLFID
jgi:hypothetical protein